MSAMELAKKHPEQFLTDEVFPGLYVDEFKFSRNGGKLGTNMISEHVVIPSHTLSGGLKPTGAGSDLAIHLNCVVKASALQNNTITIRVELFHITVRSAQTQRLIDKNGPSAITAENSIHLGVNTDWKTRGENLKALADEIGVAENQTLFEVAKKQGYNNAYMRILVKTFKTKVEGRIHQLLGGGVAVHWEGSLATDPFSSRVQSFVLVLPLGRFVCTNTHFHFPLEAG